MKIGIRNIVMPGRAHADDRGDEVDGAEDRAETGEREAEDPQVARRRPASTSAFDSGAYANQPKAAAPPGVRKPAAAIRPPNRYIQ